MQLRTPGSAGHGCMCRGDGLSRARPGASRPPQGRMVHTARAEAPRVADELFATSWNLTVAQRRDSPGLSPLCLHQV